MPGYRPQVATGLVDHHGNATHVACMTCHATREPNLKNGVEGTMPKAFHQGQVYAHGEQSCLSCHHADDYDALRLADGRKLAFAEAQKLCTQCHGPQTRDYLNGSHGGMRGYWDKTKGARMRNTCTDCHDPHAPAFPLVTPIFAPRDGGARQQAEREAANARLHPKPSDLSAHD
jgi:formate-dependent nitrite reductase cytochrome c552 subunit